MFVIIAFLSIFDIGIGAALIILNIKNAITVWLGVGIALSGLTMLWLAYGAKTALDLNDYVAGQRERLSLKEKLMLRVIALKMNLPYKDIELEVTSQLNKIYKDEHDDENDSKD